MAKKLISSMKIYYNAGAAMNKFIIIAYKITLRFLLVRQNKLKKILKIMHNLVLYMLR